MTNPQEPTRTCPHCQFGTLVSGMSHEFLLRCNNFFDCGRYVEASL